MSVSNLTPEESAQIAAFPRDRVKRYAPGETSNWDEKPFRQRLAVMAGKASAHRFAKKARRK